MSRTQRPLLRDVIQIPERLTDSDFVLELAGGVTDIQTTLDSYVITNELLDNFDSALGLIKASLTGQRSKAAYLHGSFGSGKSHFMAVLHALLRGERAARERDEFAPLLAKHDWLHERSFLLVPYQMLDAKSLEQRIFGHYIEYVRRRHPDTIMPAVHRTDALLQQARHLREQIGDAQFLDRLPGGADDEWGEASWTTEAVDAAMAADYDAPERRELVTALLDSWFPGFYSNALEDAEAFVSLDAGLKQISRHASELGYDGLVLFLDELVLWLINNAADTKFVNREVNKITNLVESADPDRPAPVVSFIARQRDLREVLGEQVSGSTELSMLDALDLASGRLDTITLEDRNLPEVARQRVLRRTEPTADAESAIEGAFEQTTKLRRQVMDTLLGSTGSTGADLESFRKTYPFSPAFLDTLVDLSEALQRSRTALKLMSRLLVQRREELRLGELIPLGDLYDVLAEGGDEPFSQTLKAEFTAAQRLYDTRLRPFLLAEHGLTEAEVAAVRRGDASDAATRAVRTFTGDDRLIKTLLLSALAPRVPALQHLTAGRLAALNHGSVTSPIPGDEVRQVAAKVETWAGRFTEITYTKADDPRVGLELVGVDVDSVLDNARARADSPGARKNLVRRLLYGELGITGTDTVDGDRFTLAWRGSSRSIEVVFDNIRDEQDVPSDRLRPSQEGTWRLVLDYPFDEGTHTPGDDRNRLDRLTSGGFADRAVCWIPTHLTQERRTDLGTLAVIEFVLDGQRFEEYAAHLNPTERHRAKETLTRQGNTLREKITQTLKQAYGLVSKQPGDVVTGYDDHLYSLGGGLTNPSLPMGAPFGEAMRRLTEQMLTAQYPAHPDFDPDREGSRAVVRPADTTTILDYVRRAAEHPDRRTEVDKKHRPLMKRVANPLRLGEMHEVNFVLGSHWTQHVQQRAARQGTDEDLKVAELRRWIDEPEPHGLEEHLANLVVATVAVDTDRAFVYRGRIEDDVPEPRRISGDMLLRTQILPDQDTWDTARRRAQDILGHNPVEVLRAGPVRLFARNLSEDSRTYRQAAHRLVQLLERYAPVLRLDPTAPQGRLHTARVAAELLEAMSSSHNHLDVVRSLAEADLGTADSQRVGRSIKSAEKVAAALAGARWDTFEVISGLGAPHDSAAEQILSRLAEAASAEELTEPLAPALDRAAQQAHDLVRRATAERASAAPASSATPEAAETTAATPPTSAAPPPERGGAESRRVRAEQLPELAQRLADENPGATLDVTWWVVED
ncbi:hypothetical protein RIF23_10630 [Lipingzhangella sp. LS1_29]|uniref:Phage resistance protein n=1 Tax=Lipingzhangella rawalii TaxID=2055835 RepID=A0ABU2H7H6_9ACTN|nr:hypothetical protein [Lipingzhangella rawalii]MDS1270755.1 hypothetical protein [Lipingzhangella rawalii]